MSSPMSSDQPIVAIDLGGTRIKFGVVSRGRVMARGVLPADSASGLAPRLQPLRQAVSNLLGGCQPVAVGLALPGIIDRHNGRVAAISGKYADVADLDLSAWSREAFDAPLTLANDALAACAGEWRGGAGLIDDRPTDGLVMVTLGTGIGVAAVVDGHLLRGSHGQAILGGHLTVRVGGRPCACGNLGCAEAEASTAALPVIARQHPDFAASVLAAEPVLDYRTVFHHADRDPVARHLRDDALRVWSALCVSLVHVYDPEVLVLGGGIMASADAILPTIRSHLDHHAWTPWGRTRLALAMLGDDAALVGIAHLATTSDH